MQRIILLILALTLIIAMPSMAGRVTSTMITHLNQVYQAGAATSADTYTWRGYAEPIADVISSSPGVLSIDPGTDWSNFIGAAQDCVPYTIKNTTLVKETPSFVQCYEVFPAHRVTQQGTPNIRLWWPLEYEVPGTTFTLTILYGTPVLWDDDGAGPNQPAWVHVEQWVWNVDTDLPHLSLLLELFHELPFGLDEVPLISDEDLYLPLQAKIAAAQAAYLGGDTATAAAVLADFELEVMDACITCSPAYPNPTGPTTGIANSAENPACCKLLVDVEYILKTTGIGQPKK